MDEWRYEREEGGKMLTEREREGDEMQGTEQRYNRYSCKDY